MLAGMGEPVPHKDGPVHELQMSRQACQAVRFSPLPIYCVQYSCWCSTFFSQLSPQFCLAGRSDGSLSA